MISESSHRDVSTSSWSVERYDRVYGDNEDGVRGFADKKLLDQEKTDCEVLRIVDGGQPNTPERTSKLRRLAMEVAVRELGLTKEHAWQVGLLISELAQNAFRYSETGPESLEFIIVPSKPNQLGISVFNEVNKPVKPVQYDGDILAGDLDGVDLGEILNMLETHGFGTPILNDTTSERYDRYEFDYYGREDKVRKMAAYAIYNFSDELVDTVA